MAEISVAFRNSGALGSDFAASSVGSDLQIHLPVLSAHNHKIFVKAQRCVVLFILAFILPVFVGVKKALLAASFVSSVVFTIRCS